MESADRLPKILREFVRRSERGRLTPFLGAGSSVETLPIASQLSEELAEKYEYPDIDRSNLSRVGLYVSYMTTREYLCQVVADRLKHAPEGELRRGDAHDGWASVPASIYLTTNYDDLMSKALRRTGRLPRVFVPSWNEQMDSIDIANPPGEEPSVEQPLIVHLHGHLDAPSSMVITEDDYIQYIHAQQAMDFLPPVVRVALADSLIVFLGYSVRDWNVRMMLQGVRRPSNSWRPHFAVLGEPPTDPLLAKWRTDELRYRGIEIVWLTVRQFADEVNNILM